MVETGTFSAMSGEGREVRPEAFRVSRGGACVAPSTWSMSRLETSPSPLWLWASQGESRSRQDDLKGHMGPGVLGS